MSPVILDEIKIKVVPRHLRSKNEVIYTVGLVELEYLGVTISYIRVMCDYEVKEIYVEFPKFYNREGCFYFWVQNRDDLERIERKILNTFQDKAKTNPTSEIKVDEIDERIMSGRYVELAGYKQVTFKSRKKR